MLALGLGAFLGGSGAMAQNGWESDDWNPLSSDQTGGYTLGATGTTKYYYLKKSLNFTNGTAGGSGLKIQGTVYLYLPAGISITCQGANASGSTGAGAGIELSSGNTLYIIGGGTGTTVTATGGNAANGSNGNDGTNAGFNEQADKVWPGAGGQGGNGGGGAGAGIGSRGGTGGTGGAGGDGPVYSESSKHNGIAGSAGGTGGTATAMGNLYVANGITVNATGGSQASTGGTGGNGGSNILRDGGSNDSMAGGAGGGGGGFGGAASNIGTGGCGGGGGGGGAGGSVAYAYSTVYSVGANGGHPGANGNGTFTTPSGFGDSTLMAAGTVKDHEGDDMTCEGWENNVDNRGDGGNSGDRGNPSSNGTQNTGNLTYNITYNPIKTEINGKTGNTPNSLTVTYSPGAPNIVLPANTEGYNWVLTTYGKSCAPNGTPVNTFATATTKYFGGNGDETSRTITPVNVYGDLVFQEVATMLIMECSTSGESANNDQEIEEFYDYGYNYGYNVTTRLQNRTLYRDDHWNTICLPFAMTPAQIAASPLKGATIMKMNESVTGYYPSGYVNKEGYQVKNYGHPIVLFWFDTVDINGSGTVLEAGKPYLVKWTEPYEDPNGIWTDGNYADNGTTRHQLDFPGVTITATVPGSWTGKGTTDGNVTFQGTFSLSANLTKLDASGKMNLVLGANDKLYHPLENDAINVGACRGYFKIPAAAAAAAPQFVMGFDDGETTSIRTVNGSGLTVHGSDTYYNLNGQRLSAPQKGINIVNGKKVIIK